MNKVLGMILAVLIAVTLNGLIIMVLWNAILPDLLAVKAVSFLQAIGLGVLVRALVKGAEVKFNKE